MVVSIGLVLGAEKLKPISWRDWAGQIERDGGARNPYLGLEERYGFWDIRVRQTLGLGLKAVSYVNSCYRARSYEIYADHADRLNGRSLRIGCEAKTCRRSSNWQQRASCMWWNLYNMHYSEICQLICLI